MAGVAHAQSAVAEHFDFNGGVEADVLDGIPGQFPGEYHTAHAQIGTAFYAVQVVDGELGGAVDGNVGDHFTQHAQHTEILHQNGVHTHPGSVGGHLGGGGQFPVGEQGVKGQIDLYTP